MRGGDDAAAEDLAQEDQRVAIVLCDVEDRTSAEAAQIVGVPEGTIRTRLFHGRSKLREARALRESTDGTTDSAARTRQLVLARAAARTRRDRRIATP